MSLSRYFKSSNSFQPKEIVRDDSADNGGWHATPPSSPLKPFQNQTIASPEPQSPANQQPLKDQEFQQPKLNEITPDSQVPPPPSPQTEPTAPPPTPIVDLSKYIEITAANEQIEAAYQKGLTQGQEKAEDDFGSATSSFLNACQQLDTIRETLIANSGEEIHAFILSIAEKIIRSSVTEQSHTVIATIEEALQRAVKSDEFFIYVNPEDFDVVAEKSGDFIAGVSGLQNVVIKKDPTIEQGGAKIESENCTIDATISSQFEMIKDALKDNI